MSTLSAGSIGRYFSRSDSSTSSNFAMMCERAALALHRHASKKCLVCEDGVRLLSEQELRQWKRWISEAHAAAEVETDHEKREKLRVRVAGLREGLSRASNCSSCNGSGYTATRHVDQAHAMDSMFTTVRCSRCRSTGTDPTARSEGSAAFLVLGDRCRRCARFGAHGFIVPVTVRSVGSTKSGKPPKRESGGDDFGDGTAPTAPSHGVAAASWVDEDELIERGRVGRELGAIRQADPVAFEALEQFHGPDGDRWGGTPWGRSFALWSLTAAGKQLAAMGAERSRGGHGYLIPALALIASEREAEKREPNKHPRRRALIGQADRQARELQQRMLKATRGETAA